MRILYLHQYFCPPGGSGNNRSYELARTWVEQGHEVSFITSTAYFPEDHPLQKGTGAIDGIQLHVVDTPYSHMMGFRRRIRAWLSFYRIAKAKARDLGPFDLIYASSTPLTVGELGRRLARKWRIPFVFETVDVWPDVPVGMGILRNPLLIAWLNRRTNRIYRESAAVVALSEGMRDQVLSHGVDPGKVHVFHNGTNPDVFGYLQRPPRENCQVIYTGTVGLANGLDGLLEVARRLQERKRSDVRFLVLGRGNDHARITQLAKRMGLRNVEFRDRVPKEEVPGLLAAADIGFVCFAPHPVLEANSANKFYDYLATGLPVLLNYEGWQAEYVRENDCGRAAPMGDAHAATEALLEMAGDPPLRREMGRRGRELVFRSFDRRTIAQDLLGLFLEILK